MKQSDYKPFCSIMLETAEAVDKALSPEKIAVFFKDLADLDIRAIKFAMEKHRKESKWFPKVAEVRELARLYKPPPPPGIAGREVKLLESPQMAEDRRQENLKRVRELMAGLGIMDAQYGTSLKKKVSQRERLQVLAAQKEQIRDM